jgi:hypothetical protein
VLLISDASIDAVVGAVEVYQEAQDRLAARP